MVVVLEGPSPDRVRNATLAGIGLMLVWSVAVAVRSALPGAAAWVHCCSCSPVSTALQTLLASPDPYLFTLARVARPAVEVLVIWVMLAFPTGRLREQRERVLVIAAALAVLLLWLPGLMLSPRIPLPGPFVMCHPLCPRNVLFVADRPELSHGR